MKPSETAKYVWSVFLVWAAVVCVACYPHLAHPADPDNSRQVAAALVGGFAVLSGFAVAYAVDRITAGH